MSGHALSAPPRPLPLALPLGAAVAFAVLMWALSVGDVRDYVGHRVPPGQLLYVCAKLAGLAAGTLLTVHIVLVLLRDGPVLQARFTWDRRHHMAFGLLTMAALVTHVALFVAAASLRGNAFAWDLLLPVFGHDPYRTGLSLGSLGFLALLALAPLGARIPRSKSPGRLRRVHRLGILALALGIAHAYVIGSEKGTIISLAACGALVAAVMAGRQMTTLYSGRKRIVGAISGARGHD